MKSQQVARGLNAISSRIVKNRGEVEKYIDSIENADGTLKSTYEILKELKPAWDKMGDAERATFQTTVAGVNQGKIFAAIMSQMDVAVESYSQALNSAGMTMKQNEIYMQSLGAKVSLLKAEFEKFVIGEGGLQSVAKLFVDLATKSLKLINDLGGLPIILSSIISYLLIIKKINITNLLTSVVSKIPKLISMIENLEITYEATSGSIVLANEAMTASIPIFGFVLAGLTALIGAVNLYRNSQKEFIEKQKQQITSIKEEMDSFSDLENKISQENLTRKELLDLIRQNEEVYDEEMEKLSKVNDLRQAVIDKIEEEKRARAKEIVETSSGAYKSALSDEDGGYKINTLAIGATSQERRLLKSHFGIDLGGKKTYDDAIENLKKYKEYLEKLQSSFEEGTLSYDVYTKKITNVETEMSRLKEAHNSNITTIKEFNDALALEGKIYDKSENKIRLMTNAELEAYKGRKQLENGTKDTTQSLEDYDEEISEEEINILRLADAYGVDAEALKQWTKELGISAEALIDYADSIGVAVEDAYNIQKSYQEIGNSIDNIQDSYGVLKNAVEEYNEQGYYSIDTIQKLSKLSPEYINAIEQEGSQLKINSEAIKEKMIAELENQKLAIRGEAIARLKALANEKEKETLEDSSDATNSNTEEIEANTYALENNTQAELANQAMKARKRGANNEDIKQIINDMKSQIALVDSAIKGVNDDFEKSISTIDKSTKSTKENTQARKENEEAINAQKEALQAEKKALEAEKDALQDSIDKYEDALDFLSDKLTNAIKKLDNTRDKSLKKLVTQSKKASGIYKKEANEIDEVLEEVKKKHEKTLDDINDLFKNAEKNYRSDMDEMLDDWDDFVSRLGNFDSYLKKGTGAFEQSEADRLKNELKKTQKDIDELNEKKAHTTNNTEIESLNKQIDALEELEGSLYDQIFLAKSKEQLDKLTLDTEEKITQLEISRLEELKTNTNQYYEDKLKAEEESNKNLEEQIKLQEALENMAKAKASRVMVYKGGSWEYTEDIKSVASAQDDYNEIKREQKKNEASNELKDEQASKIEELEKKISELKDVNKKSYDEQIRDAKQYLSDLKAEYSKQEKVYKDKIATRNASYQKELKDLHSKVEKENKEYAKTKEELSSLSKVYDDIKAKYKEQTEALQKVLDKINKTKDAMKGTNGKNAFEEMFDINEKNITKNLGKITSSLSDFKKEYEAKVKELNAIEFKINGLDTAIANVEKLKTGLSETSKTSNTNVQDPNAKDPNAKDKDEKTSDPNIKIRKVVKDMKGSSAKEIADEIAKLKKKNTSKAYITANNKIYEVQTLKESVFNKGKKTTYKDWAKYASGVASVRGNQIAITGEDPNKEIVLGSKANGIITQIDNGGGVINAKSARTLAGLVNQLGKFSSSNFGNGSGLLNENNSSKSTNITIGSITLPNVRKGKDFVDYLQNFSLDMTQTSY